MLSCGLLRLIMTNNSKKTIHNCTFVPVSWLIFKYFSCLARRLNQTAGLKDDMRKTEKNFLDKFSGMSQPQISFFQAEYQGCRMRF